MKGKKTVTLEQQIYQAALALILMVLLVSLAVNLYYSINQHRQETERTIEDMAEFVAVSPLVRDALKQKSGNGELDVFLSSLTDSMTYINVIVVCDMDSIRYYHPDKSQVGRHFVGDDEKAILEGSPPYITETEGTLGRQRRAFHAVVDEQGTMIGFVMVSIFTESIAALQQRIFMTYGWMAFFFLLLGLGFSNYMVKRLKSIFMGFQPEEFRVMYMERSEVLDVLEEGILAINREGRVILVNSAAKRMLGLSEEIREGEPLHQYFPESKLLDTLKTKKAETNVLMRIGNRHVITSRIPLIEKDGIAGAISIFRDRTEVIKMAEELSGIRYMLDALRAFNHEFMNKLHVILGYLHIGEVDNAVEYITHTTLLSSQAVREVVNQLHVSRLAALVIGKMMQANELGIQLKLKNDSICSNEALFLPMDCYVTVIGNLLENAIEELNRISFAVKEVKLGIYCTPDYNLIVCEDTGGGIPDDIRSHIFEQGVSGKGENRGTGLTLIRDIVERYHGSIIIETEPEEGTCITVSFTK